ncbi:MAG: PorT family protein [Rikenellaceae bacterium]|nr:PorT family protein [Rikenellaceae bacterium]
MKKLLLLFVFTAIVSAVSAQDYYARDGRFSKKFRYGVTGGLNVTGVSHVDDSEAKASIFAGVFAEFKLGRIVGIQPEVIYSRQGWHSHVNDTKTWHRLNYINIPVLVKLYLIDGLSLDLGPQFGILLNAKAKMKLPDGDKVKRDIDHVKGGDISFDMGLTYNFRSNVFVNARYNLGLTDNLKHNSGDNFSNRVFQLGIGYAF